MKIQKFNESVDSNVEIRTIPIDVEVEFYIKKNDMLRGRPPIRMKNLTQYGNFYIVKAVIKDNLKDDYASKWNDAKTIGDRVLEEDINNVIDDYLNRISKEHRTEKKYNL